MIQKTKSLLQLCYLNYIKNFKNIFKNNNKKGIKVKKYII